LFKKTFNLEIVAPKTPKIEKLQRNGFPPKKENVEHGLWKESCIDPIWD